jgi:hypothetical protein
MAVAVVVAGTCRGAEAVSSPKTRVSYSEAYGKTERATNVAAAGIGTLTPVVAGENARSIYEDYKFLYEVSTRLADIPRYYNTAALIDADVDKLDRISNRLKDDKNTLKFIQGLIVQLEAIPESAAGIGTPGLALMPISTGGPTLGIVQQSPVAEAARLGVAAAAANASATAAAFGKGLAPPAPPEASVGMGVDDNDDPQGISVPPAAVTSSAPAALLPAAAPPIEPCRQKTTIEKATFEKVLEHIRNYIKTLNLEPIGTKVKLGAHVDNALNKILPKPPVDIDIVNPQRRDGTNTYDQFSKTCVGSHALTIKFDNKENRKSSVDVLSGGGDDRRYKQVTRYTFVFLIAVPGKELKSYTPKNYEATTTENPAGGGKKNGTLKRNRGDSNHVGRLHTRSKRP